MAVWLQVKVRERGLSLWPSLYAVRVCLCCTAPLQLHYAALTLYECLCFFAFVTAVMVIIDIFVTNIGSLVFFGC